MDLESMVPLVVYDDRCQLCTKFAKFVGFLSGNRLPLVGHYSKLGEQIRRSVLDSSALDMFWLIDGKTAFGGRAALAPLIKTVISRRFSSKSQNTIHADVPCDARCSTVRAVFVRSASLITNSKKIRIN